MLHLIRFYSGNGEPTLLYWQDGKVETSPLSGLEDLSFSPRRACIGWKSPGSHHVCANSAINIRQCPTCAAMDVSRAYTVGDFSGYPALYKEASDEEYALYLAAFGEDIIKCGVTRSERFLERMREQGADFGCIVAKFQGPDMVYSAEAQLQSRFMFSNSVRLAQKIRRLDFDSQAARENFASSLELVRSSGVLPDFSPGIIDLSGHYPRVHSPHISDSVLGKILGAKGELLFFRSEFGSDYVVNMRGHVGHFFERKKE